MTNHGMVPVVASPLPPPQSESGLRWLCLQGLRLPGVCHRVLTLEITLILFSASHTRNPASWATQGPHPILSHKSTPAPVFQYLFGHAESRLHRAGSFTHSTWDLSSWHVGSNSPSRDQTQALCMGSMGS